MHELLQRLEEAIGRRLSTSVDYTYMSEQIAARTGQSISSTTLKRIGGYLDEDVTTRRSTLDLLARALGYNDFDAYLSQRTERRPDSNPAMGQWLDASKLTRGSLVELSWFPDRRCVVRYLGDESWEIVSAVATRLAAGMRFRCRHIIAGQPLQIVLEPSPINAHMAPYICGRTHGIRFRILNS